MKGHIVSKYVVTESMRIGHDVTWCEAPVTRCEAPVTRCEATVKKFLKH